MAAATPTDAFSWMGDGGALDAVAGPGPAVVWEAAEHVWANAAHDMATAPPRTGTDGDDDTSPVGTAAEQQAHLAALERDAFTKGYAQGERAGLEAGGQRAEAMLRRLAGTLEELGTLRDGMMRQTERQLVELALAIARRVLHREVSIDPELAGALAHVALERLGPSAPAVIRLHPDDYTTVSGHGTNLSQGRSVKVLPDPAVARGGCLVESDFGNIDASVDAQVAEVARIMLGEDAVVPVSRPGAP